jgi:hypothetical protein
MHKKIPRSRGSSSDLQSQLIRRWRLEGSGFEPSLGKKLVDCISTKKLGVVATLLS